MIVILGILALVVLFALLGAVVHFLWIAAVVVFLVWAVGFFIRGVEGRGWYRRRF